MAKKIKPEDDWSTMYFTNMAGSVTAMMKGGRSRVITDPSEIASIFPDLVIRN